MNLMMQVFSLSSRRGRRARMAAAVFAVFAVVGGSGVSSASAATADVVMADQLAPAPDWWYTSLKVQQVHDQGYTGKGVKIAVIEFQINSKHPVVKGADLKVDATSTCATAEGGDTTEWNEDSDHGVSVASMLVGNGVDGVQGMAPGAKVTVYAMGPQKCAAGEEAKAWRSNQPSPAGKAISKAIDDGNDVISISSAWTSSAADQQVIAEAVARGAIVVSSTPNTQRQIGESAPGSYNGVVSVAPMQADGKLVEPDGSKALVVRIPDVTLVAPGVDIRVPGKSGSWAGTNLAWGSSLSAPIVAGALGLLGERVPGASGNQLLQALVGSTFFVKQGRPRDVSGGYGFGPLRLDYLMASDPLSLPDVNPLMDKVVGKPSQAQVDAAGVRAGVRPSGGGSPAPSPSPLVSGSSQPLSVASGSDGGSSGLLVWVVGGIGVGVLVVVVGVVMVVSRRRGRGRGAAIGVAGSAE